MGWPGPCTGLTHAHRQVECLLGGTQAWPCSSHWHPVTGHLLCSPLNTPNEPLKVVHSLLSQLLKPQPSQAFPRGWLPKFPASVPGAPPAPPGPAPPALTGGPSGPRYPFAPLAPRGEMSLFWNETAGVTGTAMSPPLPHLLVPKGTQPPPCPALSGCRPRRWRPRPRHHTNEGCTHVLSGVPGFTLISLEARVAFRALQVTGSTWSVGCNPGAVRARLGPGPRPSWAFGPPEAPPLLLFLRACCSQPATLRQCPCAPRGRTVPRSTLPGEKG